MMYWYQEILSKLIMFDKVLKKITPIKFKLFLKEIFFRFTHYLLNLLYRMVTTDTSTKMTPKVYCQWMKDFKSFICCFPNRDSSWGWWEYYLFRSLRDENTSVLGFWILIPCIFKVLLLLPFLGHWYSHHRRQTKSYQFCRIWQVTWLSWALFSSSVLLGL